MDILVAAVVLVAVVGVFLIAGRRRPTSSPAADGSEAVRRDMSRLIEELQAASREQVARLDREVRRLQEAVAEAEKARIALEESRSLAVAHLKSAAPAPPPKPPEKPANPLHARVFELRDSGKDPAHIGVETGLEVGEVELILGLRRMPPRA